MCDENKKIKTQEPEIIKKVFYSPVNMLRWLDSQPETCKKSFTVDYNENFILVFTASVEIPKPKREKTWKLVQKQLLHPVNGKNYRLTIEEESSDD